MRSLLLVLMASLAVEAGFGCASHAPSSTAAAQQAGARPHAECLVCKHENDLACVDIEVEKDTPHATIEGREYYFCSQDCKRRCLKEPAKYLNQR